MRRIGLIKYLSSRFDARESLPKSIRIMRAVAICGMTIAVAALVIANSIGRGFEKQYRDSLLNFNAHVIVMGNNEISEPDLLQKKIIDEPSLAKTIIGLTPFIYREGLVTGGGKIKGVVMKGVDFETLPSVNSMKINYFGKSGSEKEFSVILGKSLATELGISNKTQTLNIVIPKEFHKENALLKNTFEIEVVGTFESGMHDYDAQYALMSLSELYKLFKVENKLVTGLEIKLSNPDNAWVTSEEIKNLLGPEYQVVTWSDLNHDLLSAVKLERMVSSIIMGIMVFVASLNVIAVLVLLTIYRFHEISILKSLGLQNKLVRRILEISGMSIVLKGVLFGISLGALLSFLVSKFRLIPLPAEIYLIDSLPVDISFLMCGAITIICLGVGCVTSIFASNKLSKASIAEGLHIAR